MYIALSACTSAVSDCFGSDAVTHTYLTSPRCCHQSTNKRQTGCQTVTAQSATTFLE